MHCPTCIYCGARLIQNIQMLNRPREERSARCKAVLQDWMGYGHDEAELRRLAKGPKPIDPNAREAYVKAKREVHPFGVL